MPNLPDIGNMAPDEFLSRLDRMREELVGELADVLGEAEPAEATAERLADLFEEYALGDAESDPEPLVEVRVEGESLVFGREDVEREVVLERVDGVWSPEADIGLAEAEDRAEAVAAHILKLVPWWQEGAFTDRVGRPEAYRRDEE